MGLYSKCSRVKYTYIDFFLLDSGKREALENNKGMNSASTSTAVGYGFQETGSWGSLTKDQRQGGHPPVQHQHLHITSIM